MSLKIPKSGLAMRMRDWMKARTGNRCQRRFTIMQLCAELEIQPGKDHQWVRNTLLEFCRRGEVESYFLKKCNRRQYIYVYGWTWSKQGKQNQRIFKAMYVSTSFAVTDIQRLSGVKERDWIDRIVRQLKKDGHLQQICRRLCAHGAGAEKIYHIANRDRFKLEVMKGN
jgi:hypothetical protein